MKNTLSKYFFPLAALAALIAYLLCHFQEKRCIDPITTYEVLSDGFVIEPDSTIAGVTQVKVKVTTLDSPSITLLDVTIAPNAQLFVPVPPNVPAVRVAQTYLNEDEDAVVDETENLKTAGIIVGVDVIIRPLTDPLPPGFGDCCNSNDGNTSQLNPNQVLDYNWDGWLDGWNLLKITLTDNNNNAPVSFIVAYYYDALSLGTNSHKPTIAGLCPDGVTIAGATTGFTTCDGDMTTMYNNSTNPNLNFTLHFYKFDPGGSIQMKIIPESTIQLTIKNCTQDNG